MIGNPNNNAYDLWLVGQSALLGNRVAFGMLVERHQSGLRRYLLYLTGGNGARADDLAQETFLKAFNSLRQFRGTSSFRGWLFRIAYRNFLDSCRAARITESLADTLPGDADQFGVNSLHAALGCLDDTEKNLILLSAVEQLSHSSIANITDMPLGSVKSTIARAKTKLRVYLKNEEL